jgi:hypothetical protein
MGARRLMEERTVAEDKTTTRPPSPAPAQATAEALDERAYWGTLSTHRVLLVLTARAFACQATALRNGRAHGASSDRLGANVGYLGTTTGTISGNNGSTHVRPQRRVHGLECPAARLARDCDRVAVAIPREGGAVHAAVVPKPAAFRKSCGAQSAGLAWANAGLRFASGRGAESGRARERCRCVRELRANQRAGMTSQGSRRRHAGRQGQEQAVPAGHRSVARRLFPSRGQRALWSRYGACFVGRRKRRARRCSGVCVCCAACTRVRGWGVQRRAFR